MLTVYEKPTCSTCRKLRELLEERGIAFTRVDYYATPFTAATLTELLAAAAIGPRAALRTRSGVAAALGITDDAPGDAGLIALMVAHPDLIERPLVRAGEQALVARPVERVLELVESPA